MFWGWSDFKFSWTLICCHLVLKKVWFFELKFSQNLLYRNKTSSAGTLFFVLFVQIFQFKVFSFKERSYYSKTFTKLYYIFWKVFVMTGFPKDIKVLFCLNSIDDLKIIPLWIYKINMFQIYFIALLFLLILVLKTESHYYFFTCLKKEFHQQDHHADLWIY